MDIRQLETFVEVAKYQSFSKAAEQLFITQPTVTNHIQNLEQELDISLISRMGKTIELTNEGKILYEYAQNILNLVDNVKYDLLSNKEDIKGNLTLFTSSVPRKILLPDIMKGFHDEHKNITFDVREKDSSTVFSDINSGRADFGFVGKKIQDPNLELIELMEDEVVMIINPDFPAKNGNMIAKDEITEFKWIFREDGSGTQTLVDNTLENNCIPANKIQVIARIEDLDLTKRLVEKGLGVSFLSIHIIKDEVQTGKLKYLRIKDVDFKRQFYFAFHKYRKLSPINKLFCDYMINSKKK